MTKERGLIFGLPFWWAIFAFELTALLLIQLPAVYNFSNFVLYDPGSIVRADWLISQSLSPTVDFGYSYGLLSLIYGRLLFAAGGQTPGMYLVGTWLMEMLIALGLARFAIRRHWAFRALLIVAAPYAVQPTYLALAHPMEAALLIHALADLADGRRARALALTSACVFVKPSLAYALGLMLLISVAWRLWRERANGERTIKYLISPLAPAALTISFCATLIAAYFGWRPLLNSILPFTGRRSYAALDFGFFGSGRKFWSPEFNGAGDFIWYYLTTPTGFWITASLALCACCALMIFGFKTDYIKANDRETLIAMTVCHLFFILALYAWPGSWTYYSYLLVLGAGIGVTVYRSRWIWALLMLLALTGYEQRYRSVVGDWSYSTRSPETAMLWADNHQREEWTRVLEMARRKRLLFLHNGCASLLFPTVQSPPSWFFSPGIQTHSEIAAIRRQIETADAVVSFNHAAILDPWTWQEFADQRSQFAVTWRGVYLTIHERR